MNRKFNLLHQMRPIYYLPVLSLALTCRREIPIVIKGTTTKETVFQKPATQGSGSNAASSSKTAAPSSGSGSDSSSIIFLPPAAPSGGSGSDSLSTSSPAAQSSGSGSDSSSITSLPPAAPSGGSGSDSLSTSSPAAQSSVTKTYVLTPETVAQDSVTKTSELTTEIAAQDSVTKTSELTTETVAQDSVTKTSELTTETVAQDSVTKTSELTTETQSGNSSLQDKIKEVVTNIEDKCNKANKLGIEKEILIIQNNNKKQVAEEQGKWYTGIQENDDKWKNWNELLRNPGSKIKLSNFVTVRDSDIRLKYFKDKVMPFLKNHLLVTQRPQFNFEELQGEIQQAKEEVVQLANQHPASQSDTKIQIIFEQAQTSLNTYADKLKQVQTGLESDYYRAAKAFHQRCREFFNSVLKEIEAKKATIKSQDAITKFSDEIEVLTQILAQLPPPEKEQD